MSVKRTLAFVLVGVLLALIGSHSAFTQMGGGDLFDLYSGGKDEFDVATVSIPPQLAGREPAEQRRARWAAFLQKKGVSDGKMTRDLVRQFANEVRRRQRARQKQRKGNGGSFAAGPLGPPLGAPAGRSPAPGGSDRIFDLYSGGKDEFDVATVAIPPQFTRGESAEQKRARWAAFLQKKGVSDGKMTRDLFRQFADEVRQKAGRGGRPPGATPPPAPGTDQERRPLVYRRGKLPKELPPWFAQLDRDGDSQVGLYEWMAAGRAVNEFLAMDLNGDGFLTAEEVLRFLKAHKGGGPGDGKARSPSVEGKAR